MCTTNCNASSKSTYMGRTMIYVRRTGEGTIYVNLKGGTISKDIQING